MMIKEIFSSYLNCCQKMIRRLVANYLDNNSNIKSWLLCQQWLEKRRERYMSHEVQNELIKLMALSV